MSLPASYHLQDGCHNCARAFRPWNPAEYEAYCAADIGVAQAKALYDEWDALQLTGSTASEAESIRLAEEYAEREVSWHNWATPRWATMHGKCDLWEKDTEPEP